MAGPTTRQEQAPQSVRDALDKAWPGYASPRLDGLRATEFSRLDATGAVYLDYTGAALHAASQVRDHGALLLGSVLGNPHSVSPAAHLSTDYVRQARQAVLAHFGADPAEYAAIFTSNATGALRLLGENHPFGPQHPYLLTQDHHNSVAGISAFARRAGADVRWVPPTVPDLRLDRAAVIRSLEAPPPSQRGLFSFPAQSNFSGVRHPLDLVGEARSRGWQVLLDAAAYAPTSRLDLRSCPADYVSISFYKMFGYPTGVGCLLIRRERLARWQQPWYAGGNVRLASVLGQGYVPGDGEAAFEDGTINFLALPAVECGLRFLQGVGLDEVGRRIGALTGFTLEAMQGLRHASGRPLVRVFGPQDMIERGATVAFTLHDVAGRAHDIREVAILAGQRGISMRSGFFCNPGAGEAAFGLAADDLLDYFRRHDFTFDDLRAWYRTERGFDIGALRVSFGLPSTIDDAWSLICFLRSFLDRTTQEMGTTPGGSLEEDTVCAG